MEKRKTPVTETASENPSSAVSYSQIFREVVERRKHDDEEGLDQRIGSQGASEYLLL
ncbi:hypothetical protein [Paracoccus sp. IB05]|uniref:hypothetical protein n=1 Tax=Paracoccus sp. IB05 TaxID=2779367 RepID=UPI0018E7F167|nr:hypothetical protein [Paracoccus sp. IB05]MBJ2150620.1 hypothetical protein [Paracoccus sp. IB05]